MPHGLKTAKLSTSVCPRLKWFLPETTSAEGTNDNIFNMREKELTNIEVVCGCLCNFHGMVEFLYECCAHQFFRSHTEGHTHTHTAMFTEGSPLSSARRERQGRTDKKSSLLHNLLRHIYPYIEMTHTYTELWS